MTKYTFLVFITHFSPQEVFIPCHSFKLDPLKYHNLTPIHPITKMIGTVIASSIIETERYDWAA
jgi:hypothetical protein